ncbi:CRISPR-associated endoribonuclease [Tepiditoga spiralis]|uniref:CRISPR-associated endoribonuclease n=1 Tax=Tepiditoga spiralis TaxID=2108365 RepID=A0A7G1G568_9BACT|nr:CRISPR-associated endoribonuclease Cas6 [Tepiditoga spiralis]BBE30406.1 CRISPR-associated endoribonuclease [Tepiditoga spiralis]
MRLNIKFSFDTLEIPINYNHILQAIVLKLINDETYQKFIHDVGFKYKNRNYKLYSFSRLNGNFKYNKEVKKIKFYDFAIFSITSINTEFMKYISKTLLFNNELYINNQKVVIEEISGEKNEFNTEYLRVKSLSPVVVYSTFKDNNKNKTYYYTPYEEKFYKILKKNIIKKYSSYYNEEINDKRLNIRHVKNLKEVVTNYKGFIIKGWMGEYELTGNPKLLNVALNTGLGSKNSMGYGFIEKI